MRIKIELSVLDVPVVRCRANIAWAHIHDSVRFDQVGMTRVTPISEQFLFNCGIGELFAAENNPGSNRKRGENEDGSFHRAIKSANSVPLEYKKLYTNEGGAGLSIATGPTQKNVDLYSGDGYARKLVHT
jgi:hypothetical protein